ncbi:hypothetical protein Aduo_012163 [Ancylostoma duodenale]
MLFCLAGPSIVATTRGRTQAGIDRTSSGGMLDSSQGGRFRLSGLGKFASGALGKAKQAAAEIAQNVPSTSKFTGGVPRRARSSNASVSQQNKFYLLQGLPGRAVLPLKRDLLFHQQIYEEKDGGELQNFDISSLKEMEI